MVGSKEKGRRAFRVKENVRSVLEAKRVMSKSGGKKHGEIQGEKKSMLGAKEKRIRRGLGAKRKPVKSKG